MHATEEILLYKSECIPFFVRRHFAIQQTAMVLSYIDYVRVSIEVQSR